MRLCGPAPEPAPCATLTPCRSHRSGVIPQPAPWSPSGASWSAFALGAGEADGQQLGPVQPSGSRPGSRSTSAAEPEATADRDDVSDYGEFLASLPPDRYPTLVRLADQVSQPVRDRQFAYGMAFLLDGVERRGRPR